MIHLDYVTILYVGAIGLLAIGAAGLVICNNFFRILLALVVLEAGANLLLVLMGYRGDAKAPILGFGPDGAQMVDPIPQTLVLTAIVIGVAVQALAVSILVRVFRSYGTLDIRELKARFEHDIAVEMGIEPPRGGEAPAGGRIQSSGPPNFRPPESHS